MRDALHDGDFIVIARTDAIAVEGFEAALDRAAAYLEAGADMIFVEAPTTEAQIETIARGLPGYKLINMFHGGKTPLLPARGCRNSATMSSSSRATPSAPPSRRCSGCLRAIARDGSAAAMIARHGLVQGARGGDRHRGLLALDKRYSVMSHGPAGDNPHTLGIAAFVAGLSYERIPAAVIARIKLLILDSLGCAIYGTGLPWSHILITTLTGLDQTKACGSGAPSGGCRRRMRRWSTAPWCRASNSTTCIAPGCCMWAR